MFCAATRVAALISFGCDREFTAANFVYEWSDKEAMVLS
jgi:hypothetical protein